MWIIAILDGLFSERLRFSELPCHLKGVSQPACFVDACFYCLTTGVMTYKILHDLCPESLRYKFTERSMISKYRTTNRGDLQIPKVRLEYAKRSFYFSGVKNWNDILDKVREKESIARFKTDFREYLLNLSQDPNTTPW